MFYNMKAQIDSGEQCQKEYRNHRDYRNRRKWKGSIVVEASYLLPFTLVLYGIIIFDCSGVTGTLPVFSEPFSASLADRAVYKS